MTESKQTTYRFLGAVEKAVAEKARLLGLSKNKYIQMILIKELGISLQGEKFKES